MPYSALAVVRQRRIGAPHEGPDLERKAAPTSCIENLRPAVLPATAGDLHGPIPERSAEDSAPKLQRLWPQSARRSPVQLPWLSLRERGCFLALCRYESRRYVPG